jgi:hypothetical protein
LTSSRAFPYADRAMEFWEEMSPGVKRYIVIGAVLLIALLAFRKCVMSSGTSSTAPAAQRGVPH